MPRYTDVDALLEKLRFDRDTPEFRERAIYAISQINNAPTADVQEVKHGRWVDRYNDGDWHCSICGAIVEKEEQTYRNWYWCYHCGAKMSKEK